MTCEKENDGSRSEYQRKEVIKLEQASTLNVVKLYETLARIISEREGVLVTVKVTKKKDV